MSDAAETEPKHSAPDDGSGDDMHIHKPKAAHSPRELLSEIAVIVVGILIALGLEQTIEFIHWNEQVSRTEGALQRELKKNFQFAYERRLIDACEADRIGLLRDRLLEPGPKWAGLSEAPAGHTGFYKASTMPVVIHMVWRPWRTEAWQTALTSGALNHMPPDRVAIYARIYDQVGFLKQAQDDEQAALHRVGSLAFDRDLTPSDRSAYLDRLETIASLSAKIVGSSGQLIHAPFTLGEDGFHLSQADASSLVDLDRSTFGACVTREAIPTPKDPASSFWFTDP